LTFFGQQAKVSEISKGGKDSRMTKLTEGEISWLMSALILRDCSTCIWRENQDDRYACFSRGDAPCKLFADKVLQGLERAELI
jgi:hypothetical protein